MITVDGETNKFNKSAMRALAPASQYVLALEADWERYSSQFADHDGSKVKYPYSVGFAEELSQKEGIMRMTELETAQDAIPVGMNLKKEDLDYGAFSLTDPFYAGLTVH